MINLIVAMDLQRVIGFEGKLPWRLPADLRRFKKITMGHPVIMGRKTWESIGRPLPGRRNIVVTRNPAYRAAGCEIAHGLDEALRAAGEREDVFVIGGGELYAQALPRAARLYVTEVETEVSCGDVRFPEIDRSVWDLEAEEVREPDGENPHRLRFLTYVRKGAGKRPAGGS